VTGENRDMGASPSEVVLVTGGASGIGAATAEAFAKQGKTVVIADRRLDAAEDTARRIGALACQLDIGSQEQIDEVAGRIERDLGVVRILVNCAGPLQNTDRPEDLAMKMWDRITDVHLRGTYMTTVRVGARMAATGGGSIVTVASVMGMRSGPLHAYGPAKAALINLTECLAAEWGPKGVRINTVSPGFVETPALHRGVAEQVMDVELLRDAAALQRLVKPREIADAILFLASPAAGAITGCNLPVDAGYLVAASWGAYGGLRKPEVPFT
jgi:NAD(P)-dependent dehydrogenase (short-subunit alcohol dehydrogenase family)